MTEKSDAANDLSPAEDYEAVTSRVLHAAPALVYEAWTNPEHLAQWWGPDGFTNTFHECDVRPGGRWEFVMHGPDGVDYPNTSEFVEIVPERIVLRHTCAPYFQLTATFEDPGDGTTELTWRQLFDDAAIFNAVKSIVVPAN